MRLQVPLSNYFIKDFRPDPGELNHPYCLACRTRPEAFIDRLAGVLRLIALDKSYAPRQIVYASFYNSFFNVGIRGTFFLRRSTCTSHPRNCYWWCHCPFSNCNI
jgi:hypothetical protein